MHNKIITTEDKSVSRTLEQFVSRVLHGKNQELCPNLGLYCNRIDTYKITMVENSEKT
jgi:hypothetical protein